MTMKMIVLTALLAAAGCSKKSASDCEGAMAKATDSLLATVKSNASQQVRDSLKEIAGRLRTALTQRCTEDKWLPEVVECYSKLTSQAEMQTCETKLSPEQRTKLRKDLIQVMTSTQMPGAGRGHPPTLAGSGASGDGNAAPSGAAAPTGSTEPPPAGATPPPSPPAGSTPPAAGSTPPAAASPPAAPAAPPAAAPAAPAAGSASGW